MLLTIHATAGALIGQQIKNPVLVFALAFMSHFLLDIIPHGDHDWSEEYESKTNKKKIKQIINIVLSDITGLFVFLFLLYSSRTINILSFTVGVIGAILPDFLVGCHLLSKKFFKKFYRFHRSIHTLINYDLSLSKGIFFQGVFFIVLLTLLFSAL